MKNMHGTTFRPPLQVLHVFYKINFYLFSNIISFQHVLHFDVGITEIEWNMKVKTEICFTQSLKCHKTP